MGNKKIGLGLMLNLIGAMFAYLIGSGFASGQETMQYFSSWGSVWTSLGVAVIALLLSCLAYIAYSYAGRTRGLKDLAGIYDFYAGILIIISGLFLTISLLLSILTRVWLVAKEHRNKYQIMAHTDSLTGIYNRYGFDELAEKMISKNPQTHFVAALLDIDDFKFINDIYGHSYGDRALKSLADSMKAFFPSDALLGRNGGDEICKGTIW